VTIKKTVILDLDGTLRDTVSIAHLVHGPKKDYDAFTIATATCPPIQRVVRTVREKFFSPDWLIVIASGQKEKYRTQNEAWLASSAGIIPHWMCLRGNDDHRKAPVVKREMLHRMRAYGYDPVEAWDDDPDVVAMYHEEGLDVHWVWNPTRVS
jgi:hypothetical protein